MAKEYKWYKLVSPDGTTSMYALTGEEKEYLNGMGYKLKEISIYLKTKYAINQ